jgi:nicotinate-nucleotide pyrophosphorylase (carboxylating)
MLPHTNQLNLIIDRALDEDLSQGDLTSSLLLSKHQQVTATLIPKRAGILAGLDICFGVFTRIDAQLVTKPLSDTETNAVFEDGSILKRDVPFGTITGNALHVMQAERVALNFLQHMSGIATETARYVDAVRGFPSIIVDTRKTIPGLRSLQKYAVTKGGGRNHRQTLGDGILIKDNHIAALGATGLSIGMVVSKALRASPHTLKVEVEVETVAAAHEAIESGAEILLLDNMRITEMAEIVSFCRGKAITEASGGVTLDSVRRIAETGVDFISIGALTHSVTALDISLEITW